MHTELGQLEHTNTKLQKKTWLKHVLKCEISSSVKRVVMDHDVKTKIDLSDTYKQLTSLKLGVF